MSDPKSGNAEQVLGSALSVPLNIINGIADLLIAKGVISGAEMHSILQHLVDLAPNHGENEQMVRMLLAGTISRFQVPPEKGSSH